MNENSLDISFNRQLFFQHIAQTSSSPIALEMVKAKGIYLYGLNDKKYIDLVSGLGVANIGHSHPKVVEAVQKQVAEYMHLMVYGEFIEAPQVSYAKLLTDHLPSSLNCVCFTNSGAEATEGAMKLAKRITNRSKIIAFNKSYHGSTQGALSVMGDEQWRNAFRPLLPGVYHFDYRSNEAVQAIDEQTACIILEPVQAESGIVKPSKEWLQAMRKRCDEYNVLMILDEIQTGFGRTGTLWAFEQFDILPDILLLGKALGGGMPLGAFIADKKIMSALSFNPVLGHITTFGGHPVCCAAGKAALEVLLDENLIQQVRIKEQILINQLSGIPGVEFRSAGLWASIKFHNFNINKEIIYRCIDKGLVTDWFLFAPECLRIAPPLIISEEELLKACFYIREAITESIGV